MTINQIRQMIADLETDLHTAQNDLSRSAQTVYQVELAGGTERPTTVPREYMKSYDNMVAIEQGLIEMKAHLATLNASVEVVNGLTIAAAIPKLKVMRERLNIVQRHIERYTEEEYWNRKNDGPNTASYYEVTRLNYKIQDLVAKRDELRAEINELEEAIDRCNAKEFELPV